MSDAIQSEQIEKAESALDIQLKKIDGQLSTDPGTDAAFIQDRLQELATGAQREISLSHNPIHPGFISPETDVRRNFLVDPLRIDDAGIYTELMSVLREFRNTPGWAEKPIRSFYLSAVQYAVGRYFGGFGGDEWKNREVYLDKSGAESIAVSVAEFKGKGIAVCAEKAPTAQNLMTFAGLETKLIAAENCRIPEDAAPEGHYYNLLTTDKGSFIFDPTNPAILYTVDGAIEAATPSLYKVTEEQLQTLLSGGEVTVVHRDGTRTEDGSIVNSEKTYVYGGPKKT